MWTCNTFWPIKNIFRNLWASESLIMTCLQIYWELLLLVTFLQIHSNLKDVSYLSQQNRYHNTKTTCHIMLKFSLWTIAEYFISVTATLMKSKSCKYVLNFDWWKKISENYKPVGVWLWLAYKFTKNYCCLWLFSKFFQTQKRYPTSSDKIRILTWKLFVISS